MFANFATAITSGTVITLALFYVMNMLIAMQPGVIVDSRERMQLRWVRELPPEEPPGKIQPAPVRDFIKPPVLPQTTITNDYESHTGYVALRGAPPPPGQFTGPISVISDGPLVALVRVEPTYPARALANGTEGYVLVQFDVLVDGTVANVIIIESSNKVFENAAGTAARRFRFKPRVIDGVAQVTSGIQSLFRFELKN